MSSISSRSELGLPLRILDTLRRSVLLSTIALGFVLLVVAAILSTGVVAGLMAIYGGFCVLLGTVGYSAVRAWRELGTLRLT